MSFGKRSEIMNEVAVSECIYACKYNAVQKLWLRSNVCIVMGFPNLYFKINLSPDYTHNYFIYSEQRFEKTVFIYLCSCRESGENVYISAALYNLTLKTTFYCRILMSCKFLKLSGHWPNYQLVSVNNGLKPDFRMFS